MLRALFAVLVCLGLTGAHARQDRAEYEARHVERALERGGFVRAEPKPGERVAFVELARNDVFIDEEPFPTFPNIFHRLTRRVVIERELLVQAGAPYDEALIDESMRNLRQLSIFTLVSIVPIRRSGAPQLGLLVVTRDLWSLRFEQDFQFNNGQFDTLTLRLAERNLLGEAKIASAEFSLTPRTYGFGNGYTDRRLFGQRLTLEQSLSLFVERDTDRYLGYEAKVIVARPFYSLAQRWGFSLPVYVHDREKLQVGPGGVAQPWLPADFTQEIRDRIETLPEDSADRAEILADANARALERRYAYSLLDLSAVGERQYSGDFINRVRFGAGLSSYQSRAVGPVPEEWAAAYAREVVPRPSTRVYPLVGWRIFERRFKRFADLSSYGVSEDVRFGPFAGASLTLPLETFGSTRSAVAPKAYIGWAGSPGGGLIETAFAAEVDYEHLGNRCAGENQFAPDTAWCWAGLETFTRLRVASPRLSIGRFVGRADYISQTHNRAALPLVTLGGDNGLRGFPSQTLIGYGKDRARINAEYRARPFVLSYLHMGLVAFYDAGSVHNSLFDRAADKPLQFERTGFEQSVGLGVRTLFPQFNRSVFRLDLGVPIDGSGFAVRLSAGSGQAVPMPVRTDDIYESYTGGLSHQP